MKVHLGTYLVPNGAIISKQLAKQPIEIFYTIKPQTWYTIIIFDPDAPKGTYLHYLLANVPGVNLNQGQTIFSYQPPNPPKGTGTHHYIIRIYTSKQPVIIAPEISQQDRVPFDVNDFVSGHGLTLQQQSYFLVPS